jgi:hypothetical protein
MVDDRLKKLREEESSQQFSFYAPPEEEEEQESQSEDAGDKEGPEEKAHPEPGEERDESVDMTGMDEMIDLGHTTAFSQFIDILEAFREGRLNNDETYYFLEELRLYLDSRIQKFYAIEELAPDDDTQRSLLLQGLQGFQNAVGEFKSYFEYSAGESPARLLAKLLEQAREADTLILQATTTLRSEIQS